MIRLPKNLIQMMANSFAENAIPNSYISKRQRNFRAVYLEGIRRLSTSQNRKFSDRINKSSLVKQHKGKNQTPQRNSTSHAKPKDNISIGNKSESGILKDNLCFPFELQIPETVSHAQLASFQDLYPSIVNGISQQNFSFPVRI